MVCVKRNTSIDNKINKMICESNRFNQNFNLTPPKMVANFLLDYNANPLCMHVKGKENP